MWLTVIAVANRLARDVAASMLVNIGKILAKHWLLANGCIWNGAFGIFLKAF